MVMFVDTFHYDSISFLRIISSENKIYQVCNATSNRKDTAKNAIVRQESLNCGKAPKILWSKMMCFLQFYLQILAVSSASALTITALLVGLYMSRTVLFLSIVIVRIQSISHVIHSASSFVNCNQCRVSNLWIQMIFYPDLSGVMSQRPF